MATRSNEKPTDPKPALLAGAPFAGQCGDPADAARVEPSRREVLRGGLAGLAGLVGVGAAASVARAAASASWQPGSPAVSAPAGIVRAAGRVRNVIFFVPDGMSAGSLSLLDMHSRLSTGKPSAWHQLRAKPSTRHAAHTTYAHESLVTDSAAASAAWSTGIKHRIKALCIAPDGSQPRPILMRAKQVGYRVGCVTTTTITHATPAGFYCNALERGNEGQIGSQLIERGLDVAIGGGGKHVEPAILEQAPTGTVVARTMQGLRAGVRLPSQRLVGLLSSEHIAYVQDRQADEFDLPEAVTLAAQRLTGTSKEPFFLQVEAGRVDHAAHNNDAGALLHEMIEFERTLTTLLGLVEANPGTLLVIVADHATANPGLTLYGKSGEEGLRRVMGAQRSFEWIINQIPKETPKAEQGAVLAGLASKWLKIKMPDDASTTLQRCFDGAQTDPFGARASLVAVLGSLCSNEMGVGFVSINHTADAVDLLAVGAASETMPGLIDNTDVHTWLCGLLDLPPSLA